MPHDFMIFKTRSGNNYLYDSNTNTIHPWNPPLSEELAEKIYSSSDKELETLDFPDNGNSRKTRFYVRLWRSRTKAFCSADSLPSQLSFDKYEDIPMAGKEKMQYADLVLNITESCNLRCKYCAYSSLYPGYRSHGSASMSFETAKKAVDLFFAYNDRPVFQGLTDRSLNLVFYGGEPLLNYEVLKETILYARSIKRSHWNLVISMVTNLTRMKKSYLPFFRDQNIFINVSLDGPPDEQNRYRVFKSGRPTANAVQQRLHMIKAFDEEYYYSKVRVQPTINGNSDLERVYAYFEDNKRKALPLIQTIAPLKDLSSCEFHKIYPFNRELYRERVGRIWEIYRKKKMDNHKFIKGDFLYSFADDSWNQLFTRTHSIGSQKQWYTGQCIPGRKLSVLHDGSIHICERINDSFPIGNVETGIDEETAVKILNKFFKITVQCSSCWAKNLCYQCTASTCSRDDFDFPRHCAETKAIILSNFEGLYSLLEDNSQAFAPIEELLSCAEIPSYFIDAMSSKQDLP